MKSHWLFKDYSEEKVTVAHGTTLAIARKIIAEGCFRRGTYLFGGYYEPEMPACHWAYIVRRRLGKPVALKAKVDKRFLLEDPHHMGEYIVIADVALQEPEIYECIGKLGGVIKTKKLKSVV